MNHRTQYIIKARVRDKETLAKIGEHFGVSRERVRQQYAGCQRALRQDIKGLFPDVTNKDLFEIVCQHSDEIIAHINKLNKHNKEKSLYFVQTILEARTLEQDKEQVIIDAFHDESKEPRPTYANLIHTLNLPRHVVFGVLKKHDLKFTPDAFVDRVRELLMTHTYADVAKIYGINVHSLDSRLLSATNTTLLADMRRAVGVEYFGNQAGSVKLGRLETKARDAEIRNFAQAHLGWTTEQLADHFGLSTPNMYRIINTETGATLTQRRRAQRDERIKELAHDMSRAEIASTLGVSLGIVNRVLSESRL